MTPLQLHEHLNYFECEFRNLVGDECRHAVYRNRENGHEFTILKECNEVDPELILMCCYFLNIPEPGGTVPMTSDQYQSKVKAIKRRLFKTPNLPSKTEVENNDSTTSPLE